jgi:hypothetical protein
MSGRANSERREFSGAGAIAGIRRGAAGSEILAWWLGPRGVAIGTWAR